jgi:hypothetical protein
MGAKAPNPCPFPRDYADKPPASPAPPPPRPGLVPVFMIRDSDEDAKFNKTIHDWFELTYAQYLTVPRSILEAMPEGWQDRFVALLEELDDTFDWRPEAGRYWCRLKDGDGRFVHDPFMEYRRPDRDAIERARRSNPCPTPTTPGT